MAKLLLVFAFLSTTSVAYAGEITCDVTMVGEKISPVKTIGFTEAGKISVSADPLKLMANNGDTITVSNENGMSVCRVEEKK